MEGKDLKKALEHPLFSQTSPTLIEEALALYGDGVRSFCDGEVLNAPENDPPKLGIILAGKASVSTPNDSHAVLLRFLKEGDLFGLANLFSEEGFVSVIRAEGNCRCLFFSESAVEMLLNESPTFRQSYVRFLTGRIRFLNTKIGYLTAGSAERRLALYLSALGSGEARLPDSLTSLSDLLNLGRASLYRAFDRLCEDGYLQKNGRNLFIPDADALKEAYK